MLLWYLLGLVTGVALLTVIWLIGRRGKDTNASSKEMAVQSWRAEYPAPLVIAMCSLGVLGIVAAGYAVLGGTGIAGRQAPTPTTGERGIATEVNALEQFLRNTGNFGDETDLAAQITALEERLREEPGSGEDWAKIGRAYFETQRYDDAARAFGQAMELLGETPERLADIGEAMTQANGGIVSQEAHALFTRANQRDPALVQARFYRALALEQDGALAKAAAAWQALLVGAPPEAFWRPVVEQRLAAVTVRLGGDAPDAASSNLGGTAATPAKEHEATIEQMVTSLAERLDADGDDIEGWLMLMRSYTTLERNEEARQALARARFQFTGDAAALSRIEQAAESLELR